MATSQVHKQHHNIIYKKLIRVCKICKRKYQDFYDRKCFAFNLPLKYTEDVCVICRTVKAAKLECAIMDMAEDLGFEICKGRTACAVLMNESKIDSRQALPDDLRQDLDEIPLTYPRNLTKNEDKECPASEACTALNEPKIDSRQVLLDDLREALDEIPLTYRRNLTKNEDKECSESEEESNVMGFEMVYKSDVGDISESYVFENKYQINGRPIKKEIIELYMNGMLSEDKRSFYSSAPSPCLGSMKRI